MSLKITVETKDSYWDEENERFIDIPPTTLELENSLVAISKWEMKYHRSFFKPDPKTSDEMAYYIKCMCLKDYPDEVFLGLSDKNLEEIGNYLKDPMTATRVKNVGRKGGNPGEEMTSEYMYYLMVANEIPFECQYWPIQRLAKLLEICAVKSQPSKKMPMGQVMSQNRALNKARRGR